MSDGTEAVESGAVPCTALFAAEGNPLALGDQESGNRDAQRGVVVETAPSTALEAAEPDLLL